MKRSINCRVAATLLCALFEVALPGLYGQAPASPEPPAAASDSSASARRAPANGAPVETPVKPKFFTVGFRLHTFPVSKYGAMAHHNYVTHTDATATSPYYDWRFNTGNHSPRFSIGPQFEFRLTPKMSVTVEGIYNRLQYAKSTDYYKYLHINSANPLQQEKATRTERTKASLYDFPVMVRYRGLASAGLWSRFYVNAGATMRTLVNIRTNTTTTYENGGADYNEVRSEPARRNLLGGVVGVGFRFVDDFNIKVTPDLRVTRWDGRTYASDSTKSPKTQVELGLAITF